jgi:hypothetical protein
VPVGIGAAIYLEEYATQGRISRILQTNIDNLAGVPSIIYGILGLAIFVRALEVLTSGTAFGVGDPTTANGRTILSAGLTLGLLVLPIIIINAQEAIRAVPQSHREAGYGMGGTRWQVVRSHVLPSAIPGILTGTILGHLPRHRRDCAPGRHRRIDLYHSRSQRAILQVHGAAHADLPVDHTAPARVQTHCRRSQHRAACPHVCHEWHGDLTCATGLVRSL